MSGGSAILAADWGGLVEVLAVLVFAIITGISQLFKSKDEAADHKTGQPAPPPVSPAPRRPSPQRPTPPPVSAQQVQRPQVSTSTTRPLQPAPSKRRAPTRSDPRPARAPGRPTPVPPRPAPATVVATRSNPVPAAPVPAPGTGGSTVHYLEREAIEAEKRASRAPTQRRARQARLAAGISPQGQPRRGIQHRLNPQGLREAIILTEVLGPPVSMRDPEPLQ